MLDGTQHRERYEEAKAQWPQLFENPPDARYEILSDPSLVATAESKEKSRLEARDLPASWSRTGVVYEDPYMLVLRDAVRRPDGSLGTYVRTTPASGAAGVAVLTVLGEKILLLRHFRHATRKWHLEIPRGYGEIGVSAPDQARQELREEIEADADSLVSLGAFHSNTGTAADEVELFLAEIHAVGSPQTAEGIDAIELHTPYQVAHLIQGDAMSGPLTTITDSFTIGAFTRAWLRGLLPGLPPPAPPDDPMSAGDVGA
jgi:ADP-ribose pyrophosphatase